MFRSNLVKSLAVLALLAVGVTGLLSLDSSPAEAGSGITAAGSTSVQPIMEMLAQEYMATHRGLRINVQGGGSSAGVKAAATGTAQIGMASRELKPSEKGLWEFVLAYDGIAVVTHPSNPVANLTLDQIKGIFTGQITNWAEVGGTDAPIHLVNREAGSGTRGAFEELVLDGELFAEDAIIQGSTGAVKTTVAMDPDAIGYISLAAQDKSVKAVTVDGVQATVANISSKTYKIARPFNILCKEEPSGEVADFINWFRSTEAEEMLVEEGLVPVK